MNCPDGQLEDFIFIIKVFKTWAGTKEYVESDAERFNRLWYRNSNLSAIK